MLSLSKKFGLLVLMALILIVLIFTLALPYITKIKEINAEIDNERARFEELYVKGQKLQDSKEKYLTIKEALPQLEKIFVENNGELDLITKLEKIAGENRVNQEIELGDKKTEINKNLSKTQIALHVSGTYRNLLSYLQTLETAEFYLNINSLAFFNNAEIRQRPGENAENASAANPPISLEIKGYIYYYQN